MEFLFIVIILAIVPLAWWHSSKQQQLLKQILGDQARKRGGEIVKGTLLFWPSLKLTSSRGDEIKIFVMPGGKHHPPETYVQAQLTFSHDRFRLRVCRELRILGIGTVFGQDIQLGQPVFDEAFIIQGEPEHQVRHVLNYEVQQCLLDLKDWNVVLEIKNKTLKFHTPRRLKTAEEFDRLIDAGQMLIQRCYELG